MAKLCAHISIFRRSACSAHPPRAAHTHTLTRPMQLHAQRRVRVDWNRYVPILILLVRIDRWHRRRGGGTFLSRNHHQNETRVRRATVFTYCRGARCHIWSAAFHRRPGRVCARMPTTLQIRAIMNEWNLLARTLDNRISVEWSDIYFRSISERALVTAGSPLSSSFELFRGKRPFFLSSTREENSDPERWGKPLGASEETVGN